MYILCTSVRAAKTQCTRSSQSVYRRYTTKIVLDSVQGVFIHLYIEWLLVLPHLPHAGLISLSTVVLIPAIVDLWDYDGQSFNTHNSNIKT